MWGMDGSNVGCEIYVEVWIRLVVGEEEKVGPGMREEDWISVRKKPKDETLYASPVWKTHEILGLGTYGYC